MKFLKQVEGIAYVMAKLLKYVKIKHANFLNFLFTKDSLQIKKVWELVSSPHFLKKMCFIILHKLAKFLYQNVFTS